MPNRQLIASSEALNLAVVERVLKFVESHDLFCNLAEQVHDPRIPRGKWRGIFRRELLALLHWMMGSNPDHHSKALPAKHPSSPTQEDQRVLSLLPRHGVAVHFLRRAAPFAIAGKTTLVHVHPQCEEQAGRVIHALTTVLGLQEAVHFVGQNGSNTLKEFKAQKQDLIVVTGRPETVHALRACVPCKVFGATGRCSLVVAPSPEKLHQLRHLFSGHHGSGSCTRLRGSFLLQEPCGQWLSYAPETNSNKPQAYDPADVLSRLHPSVILTSADALDHQANQCLEGYAVLGCDREGQTADLTGFAMDPVEGWPGDFLI